MSRILDVKGFEVLDSRGNPTVMSEVTLECGIQSLAFAPSGASTGAREALELRDGDSSRYFGKGVLQAVSNINGPIKDVLVGKDPLAQAEIDNEMIALDGTPDKSSMGANAILSVSLANVKAAAVLKNAPLYLHLASLAGNSNLSMPVPMMNIINGGAHANNNIDIQEFMIQPVSATNFHDAVRIGAEIFHSLKNLLRSSGLSTGVGDEGGFAPDLSSNDAALDLISQAVEFAGYKLESDILLALDCAASEFFDDNLYRLLDGAVTYTAEEFVNYLEKLCKRYPVSSIEDGLDETDWDGWKLLTDRLGDNCQLVGDDLFVTNPSIFKEGISKGIGNAILIKLNQIGTLTETIETINLAKSSGYSAVISHRSGETEDTIISDLAVATGAGQIKTGSLCRSDRIAKYNRLLKIENEMNFEIPYLGALEFSRAI